MLRILAEIQSSIGDLSRQVAMNTKLLQNLQPGASLTEDYTLPEGVVLPATTLAELQVLDDVIHGDKDLQRHLVG